MRIPPAMTTRRIDVAHDQDGAILEAARLLEGAGLVAFPTETVYGLGALGLEPRALERLFAAKKRPFEDPLILHVADPGWLDQLTLEVPAAVRRLTEGLWPGPLTVILSKSTAVPDIATAGLPSVAVRMPSHPLALALISAVGSPLAAPSANLFGRPSPTSAEHVLADLRDRIDAVLDAGPTSVGVESTVIDAREEDSPIILRPGGTCREKIESVLGQKVRIRESDWEETVEPTVSPGLLSRHYSPRAPVRLFRSSSDEGPVPSMSRAVRAAASSTEGPVGILAYEEDEPLLSDLPRTVRVEVVGSRSSPHIVAKNLFAALRNLDDSGVKVIFASLMGPDGLGETINDRLARAAGGKLEK